MPRQPITEEKIHKLLTNLPIKGSLFLTTPVGQSDLHIVRTQECEYDILYALSYDSFFTLNDDDEDDLMRMTLPRSIFTDFIAEETKTFYSLNRLINHIFAIMNHKICKMCTTAFVGFSPEDTVCSSCFLDMNELKCHKNDALCIVCHDEGDELKNRVAMKTSCCSKVICLACRSKLKAQVTDGKYQTHCPNCRKSLPSLCQNTMFDNFKILNINDDDK